MSSDRDEPQPPGPRAGVRVADSRRDGKAGDAPNPARVGAFDGDGGPRIEALVAMALAATRPGEARPVAELGYDQGAILLRLALRHPDLRVLGVEIQPGSATTTPVPPSLAGRVELRTGDAVDPLAVGECAGLVLAGLGGKTIAEALTRRPELTRALDFVLTCPSHLEAEIRPALRELGLGIVDERLAYDRGRYYECVLARPGAPTPPSDELGDAWGPLLMGRPDPLMRAYLEDQRRRFHAAFATGLRSYAAGPKAALGRKLARLDEALANLPR